MGNPGTQVISRKALADAATPPYMTEIDGLIQTASEEKDRAARSRLFEEALARLETHLQNAQQQGGKRGLHDCLALAECHWELTQPAKAIEYLKEAITLAPRDARPYALLGRYLLYKGLRDQALNFLDRAIQLDPDDATNRKLRDRAALQKKKQYTVVVNAADIGAKVENKRGGESAAAQHKKEATRLLDLGQLGSATAELAKAEHGAANEVDAALFALFGAQLVGADTTILRSDQKSKRGIGIVRTVIALLFIAMLGLVGGVAFGAFGPKGAASGDEQLGSLLTSDQTTKLKTFIIKVEEKNEEARFGEAALAHALLLLEHGGEFSHLESAEALLEGASDEVRNSPEGLAARVLLRLHPEASADKTLDEDLGAAAENEDLRDAPWLLLARADRARQLGAEEASFSLLHRAGLGERGLPRALHLLGRAYAQRGENAAALSHFERLWKKVPYHPGSLAAASLLAVAMAGDAAKEVTALEQRIGKIVEGDEIDPVDAAPAAVTLAAIAQARGDEDTRGRMLSVAIGSSASGPVTQSPGLLAEVTQLQILDFDPKPAKKLLGKNEDLVMGSVELLRNRTRADVLLGIGDKLRTLRVNTGRRGIQDGSLLVSGGSLTFAFDRSPVPLHARFDARYFPETSIQRALEVKGISPQVAERKLKSVAEIKLAQIELVGGDTAAATGHLEKVRDSADGDPEFHLVNALVKSAEKDRRGAKDAIEAALNIAPDEPRILVAAARIQLASGDAKAALESVKNLKAEGFTSPAAFSVEARAHIERGEVEEARVAIEEGKKFTDDDPELLAGEVVVSEAGGDFASAQKAATRLYKEAPEAAQAMGDRDAVVAAYVLDAMARRGNVDAAVEELSVLKEKHPDDPAVRYFLGHWLVKKGDDKAGGEKLLKAVAGRGETGSAKQAAVDLGLASPDDPSGAEPTKPDRKKKRGKKGRRR